MHIYSLSLGDTVTFFCDEKKIEKKKKCAFPNLEKISGVACSSFLNARRVFSKQTHTLSPDIISTVETLKTRYSTLVAAFLKDLLKANGHRRARCQIIIKGPNAALLDENLLKENKLNCSLKVEKGKSSAVTTLKAAFLAELEEWRNDPSLKGDKETAHKKITEVYERRLQKLDLNGLRLDSLPPCLSLLLHLKEINLSHNNLTTLPRFSSFRNLSSLNLSHNSFESLPQTVCSLPALTRLYVSHNKLASLPDLSGLAKVKIMDLSHNRIDLIPSSIGEMKSLVRLNVSYNKLGYIPFHLLLCSNLKALILHKNRKLVYLPLALALRGSSAPIDFIGTKIPISIAFLIADLRRKAKVLDHDSAPVTTDEAAAAPPPTLVQLTTDVENTFQTFDSAIKNCLATLVPTSKEHALDQAKLMSFLLREKGFVESEEFGESAETKLLPVDFSISLRQTMVRIYRLQKKLSVLLNTSNSLIKLPKSKITHSYSIYYISSEEHTEMVLHFGKSSLIDKGSFKTVTRALNLSKMEPLALAKTSYINEGKVITARNEIAFVKQLPFTPTLMCPIFAAELPNSKGVVKQRLLYPLYMGTLDSFIPKLSFVQKLKVSRDILSAAIEIQKIGASHRDLKAKNILINIVNGKVEAAIADFGLAHVIILPSSTKGTRTAYSPTALTCLGVNSQMKPQELETEDNWALGLILYKMFIDRHVYRNLYHANKQMSFWAIADAYEHQHQLDKKRYKEPIHQIIHGLMQPDARNRLSFEEALERLKNFTEEPAPITVTTINPVVLRAAAQSSEKSGPGSLPSVFIDTIPSLSGASEERDVKSM